MSNNSEKPRKEVFDYKEPFHAPQMVREITKRFKLRNAIPAQTFFVGGFTAVFVGVLLYLIRGFDQLSVLLTVTASWGMIELFNRVEPDGKKVHVFLKDYVLYIFTYQLKNQVLQHGRFIKLNKHELVYERKTVADLCVKESGEGQ